MTQSELRTLRLEVAFWALIVIAALAGDGARGIALILAAVARIAIWRLDRAMRPQRGPGFWARVWRR